VADVVVLDVADNIRRRLGEPTVTALASRFGPAGRCLSCSERLGAAPLSVRAYRDQAGIVTLIAYHAGCAASAWVDIGPGAVPRQETWSAALTAISLPAAARRRFRLRPGQGAQDQLMPLLLVHPSLEMTRVRLAGSGEAVNADLEGYSQLGFTGPGALAGACPLRATGQARMRTARGAVVLHVKAAGRTWSAPIPPPAAALAEARGGVLAGVTCDRDPGRLAAEARELEDAIAGGDVLLGWAPLPDGPHQRPGAGRLTGRLPLGGR
jgi:hypothetical protein